ncbi:MAG: VWA domain-containing protein [Spirochaetales bacterium]|nr:VWA domain-containing protein [Spirochaetales bacterium]
MREAFPVALLILLMLPLAALIGQDLSIGPDDLLMEQGKDGGYHLWIRRKPGTGSVLITESTADPARKEAVYALRNPAYHAVNGDEKRKLNGEFLDTSAGLYSLIDSTPEAHEKLGEAFHIYVPYVVEYGYAWSRSGELQILDGTYLNVRTFPLKYADYDGGFRDNPFIMRLVQKPLEGPPEDNYMDDTLSEYREIAAAGGGGAVLSTGEADILDKLRDLVRATGGKSLDLVLALDTTESMKNDMPHLRTSLVPLLEELAAGYDNLRFGIVYYKDYMEQYVTRTVPFAPDLSAAQKTLDSIRVFGGRDIPEAVYEALYAGIHGFPWAAESKMIVLVGDAPPHPRPRGSVTKEMVYADARKLGVELHTIILPQ